MLKNWTFDVPPPGAGFVTVTKAVLGMDIKEAGTVAVSCEAVTTFVARGVPFQFTTDPEAKPVPLTVSVKPAEPGAAVIGTSG